MVMLLALVGCGGAYDAGTSSGGPPSGSVSFGGGADFGAFRRALDDGKVPATESIEASGFFAEHYTSLPAATCEGRLCLHAMLSVTPDLVHGDTETLVQIGVNTPLNPETFPRPPLDLVVVVDRSGSMAGADKMTYAKQGLVQLVDQLGPKDNLTLVAFDDVVDVLYGPAPVTDRAQVKSIVKDLAPRGATNIHEALRQAFDVALRGAETDSRRVIFLTDGRATVGVTDATSTLIMARTYVKKYVQLTTIGVGVDVNLTLLRSLAEEGSGNFYFLEDPAAAREVFTQELKSFVAPIAYDVTLSFNAGDAYSVAALEGSSLWEKEGTRSAFISRPSVFLASRTSDDPDPTGGRRGGGSALIAQLKPTASAEPGHRVVTARLRYRVPGQTEMQSQDIEVTYGDHPGVCGDGGYASNATINKTTLILAFYTAFHEATLMARVNVSGARAMLVKFQTRIEDRLEGVHDEDLQDDLALLQQFINVLAR